MPSSSPLSSTLSLFASWWTSTGSPVLGGGVANNEASTKEVESSRISLSLPEAEWELPMNLYRRFKLQVLLPYRRTSPTTR
eukprot:1175546-Prorocentrum_minimum.AAC.4